MTKRFCDRCGTDITKLWYHIQVLTDQHLEGYDRSQGSHMTRKLDVCGDCKQTMEQQVIDFGTYRKKEIAKEDVCL